LRRLFLLFTLTLLAPLGADPRAIVIATLMDGCSPYLEENREVIEFEVRDLMAGEFQIEFPPEYQRVANWRMNDVQYQFVSLLNDPKVDLVITIGLLSSHLAAEMEPLPKPVFATAVLEEHLPGGMAREGVSGIDNLSYVAVPARMDRDIDLFHEMVPFCHLAVLVDEELANHLGLTPDMLDIYRIKYGIQADLVLAGSSANSAINKLPPGTDAVYMTPLFRLSAPEYRRLIGQLNRRHLPTFSMVGEDEVRQGALMGLSPGSDLPRLGRRVALNIQQVLLGEPASEISTSMGMQERLSFNRETAHLIRYSPPWDLLNDAMIFGQAPGAPKLTLDMALDCALAINPEVWAARDRVRAGRGEVGVVCSRLLPHVDLGATARTIDKARAREALGREPQYMVEGEMAVDQVLFSDRANARCQIERQIQCSRVADLRIVTLDILYEVGAAYINLLRERSLLVIERNNLELTRNNLMLACARVEIGAARRNEVYRWEAQIAIDKEEVVRREALVRIAEAELNRLLHRPVLCPIETNERTLDDLMATIGQAELSHLIETPQSFEWFSEFEICQAWRCSPELASLEALMVARCRELVHDRRALWLPELFFHGESQQRVARGGTGVSPPDLPEFIEGIGRRGQVNDYLLAFQLTFPLFEGGAKWSRICRDRARVQEICQQYQAMRDTVAFRVTSALDGALASFLSIDLSFEAVAAANRNLAFVEDAYAKGAASILDLLDAQQTSLDSERLNAEAQFTFATDLFRIMRAVGSFDIFRSEKERWLWLQQLQDFFHCKRDCR
jgi:outer membrane protein